MRTVHFHSLLVAAAVLTLAANVAAQDRSAELLNNLEVRQLVAGADPGDYAQLSAHFNALGDRYAAMAADMHKQFAGVGR